MYREELEPAKKSLKALRTTVRVRYIDAHSGLVSKNTPIFFAYTLHENMKKKIHKVRKNK